MRSAGLKKRFYFLCGLTLTLILLQLIGSILPIPLLEWGVIPRTGEGFIGIFIAPFVHGSWSHLFSNLLPLLILSFLSMTQSLREYVTASIFIIFFSGLLVWIFGRHAIHVGASGWIFGLWALLIAHAFTRHKVIDIVIALFVLFYYGTMAYGLIPGQLGVSTESHIAGVIAGLLYAWCARRVVKRKSRVIEVAK
ncbi:rhomboid family intramembrane serine protease [Proteus hauseri]|uniref:rhomboid family intramembrane serine protease n=1 Tax=Proteus hauseri TaxID=183417 RepID=UPI00100973BB|nr:rhomboid family intramembrane serine protease [Proteus hauseri]QAV23087.1 rhomboid family intramembrane serine protease [Proteus hauseri]